MTWFLLKDEEIRGPFEESHIFETYDEQSLIWGPGMEEWSDKESWEAFLNRPKESFEKITIQSKDQSNELEDKTVEEVAELALHQLNDKWFFAYEGERFGPFNQNHLILKISSFENVEKVLLWKKGENKWRLVFEFPKVLKALNQKLEEKNAA